MADVWLSGAIVSEDPFIVYSTRGTNAPLGVAGLFADYFRDKPALHLINFTWTMETTGVKDVETDLRIFQSQLPKNHFVFLCNTEMEAYMFARVGVPALLSSPAMFANELVFRALERPPEPRYDAIYNGRLTPFKRHALASKIPRLGLIYGAGWTEAPMLYDETRAMLPNAYFANHEMGGGKYRNLTALECMGLMNASHSGLALSAEEGVMRAVIEYLLCGLPVVSTRALGGRERYLQAPFATIVPDDAEAVGEAVKSYAERPLPRKNVRDHILKIIGFERHCFLLALNAIVKDLFGVKDRFKELPESLRGAARFLPDREIKAALDRLAAKGIGKRD